ncbi:PLP-dependent aminotransferase family protein [Desulfurispora thermophila]|uniref:aminotransferase-like domain-containing protein n=1 Tax=Desulfurispora thermophila TaxID=265470 RepID=UPI000372A0BD|nr:PLP-dependent aminotransferase family protein [Desulfurispora thermophila]
MDISNFLTGCHLERTAKQPLYLQLADLLAAKIADHTLPPGSKLPPERELAALLGVSRTTAQSAYRHLEEQGLVTSRVGSGTYVTGPTETTGPASGWSQSLPWAQLLASFPASPYAGIIRDLLNVNMAPGTISLAAGLPDPAFYPLERMQKLFGGITARKERAAFGHISTAGYEPLRQLLTGWLAGKGIDTTAESIIITAGSQQGLYLTAKALLEPGDYAVLESPTYIAAHQVFRACGARIINLPRTSSFPLAWLEDCLVRYRPKLLYTIPNFHNPTGRLMPEGQRRELLRLATRHRLIILEDDPYGDLYYDAPPPPPLKALDQAGGVVYLGTFSKILCPGLRLGYLVAHPALVNRMALEKQLVDLHSNNLAQWLLSRLLLEDFLPDHLAMLRREYKKRRDALVKALQRYAGNHLDFDLPAGGFYLWCRLRGTARIRNLLREAIGQRLFFVPGEAFYDQPPRESVQEMRLCFVTHPAEQLAEGARRLARALAGLHRTGQEQDTTAEWGTRPMV